MAYPAAGDAPCAQAKPPNASHAAYTGNLKRISTTDPTTVVFELCEPDVAFLSKIAAPAFAVNDAGWLATHIVAGAASDQAIVSKVNGTGPYRLERWDRGAEISLVRNDAYRGEPARNERLIVRWGDGSSRRVTELQGSTVDGIDDVDSAGVATIKDDVALQLQTRPGLSVFYLSLNNTLAPFGNERVRRALAMGIDRQRILDGYFPPGSEIASHATPCAIPNGCAGDPWYEFDPLQAKEMLAAAGFPDGFVMKIHYQDTPRAYLPNPTGVANELKAQLLDDLGIRAELVIEPEATYLADVEAGKVDGIHLLGQGVTYPDVSAYLDPSFGPGASREFGNPFVDVGKALAGGRATANAAARKVAYTKANDLIRSHVPMIPVAVAGSAAAFRADVEGAGASPLRLERFTDMTPGDRRQLVWLTTSEPPGLYCADESDPIAALVCAQLAEGLYGYYPSGASLSPSLARSCAPNPASTVWTCALRPGVVFHDGATFEADDVVTSFAVQWDAEHPLHAGREGTFPRFASWFGGFLNPPAGSP